MKTSLEIREELSELILGGYLNTAKQIIADLPDYARMLGVPEILTPLQVAEFREAITTAELSSH